jgi:phage minor structural protein
LYQYSIFNSGIETIIHVPVPDKDAPHILSAPFKESLSQAEQLTLIIPYNNPGYNLIEGMNTKVKVYDTRDNSVIFTGRVTPIKDGLNSDGGFPKEVTCEGAMSYLIDSNTRRWEFVNQTPTQILTYLLNQHNSKMDNERKIYLGTVQINQPITINTNFESTLNAIVSKIKNILGGDLRVQERNGLLYLDYLADQGTNNGAKVELRRNLKELIREYDPRDVISRGIPMGYGEGINQLDITSVNNGVEYIEDTGAIAKYGVIEDLITNKDIQNADTLLIYGRTVLAEKSQPRLTYQQTALDLSVLPGHQNERYALGDTLNTIVDVMSIDVLSRIIERERDLILNPWNPKLTISTRPIRLSDQTVDLKQRSQSLENAPQGSTYIDTFGYAESIDANHAFQLPIWLSPDILNVNRVRLHIDAQKYRAYEKGMGSSGYSKKTSGPSSTSTSGSSSSTTTVSSSTSTSGSSSSTTT